MRDPKKVSVYHSDFAYSDDGFLLTSYTTKRNKKVNILSTQHQSGIVNLTNNPKKKPNTVLYYNATKGGVDSLIVLNTKAKDGMFLYDATFLMKGLTLFLHFD